MRCTGQPRTIMKTTNEIVKFTTLANVLTAEQLKAFKRKHRAFFKPTFEVARIFLEFCEDNGIECEYCEGLVGGDIFSAFNHVNGQYVDLVQELGIKSDMSNKEARVLRVFENSKELYGIFSHVAIWGISLQGIYNEKKHITYFLDNQGDWHEYQGGMRRLRYPFYLCKKIDAEWYRAYDNSSDHVRTPEYLKDVNKVANYLKSVLGKYECGDAKGASAVLAIPTSSKDRVTILISIGDTIAWIKVPNFKSYRELKKWVGKTLLHGENAILPLLFERTEESFAKLSAMDRKLLTINRAA